MISTILFLSPVFRELYEVAPLIFGLAGVAVFGILAWNYGPGVIILHAIMILLSGLLALIIWHAGAREATGDSSPSRETVLAVAARHGEAKPATEHRGGHVTPNSTGETASGDTIDSRPDSFERT